MTERHRVANATVATEPALTKKKCKAAKQQQKPTKKVATLVDKRTTKKGKAKDLGPRVLKDHQIPETTRQGQRKVPMAGDPHGCAHTGLRDLMELDRAHLTCFAKKDAWLYNKPCHDSDRMETDAPGFSIRVVNMPTLLEKGNRAFGYYCNCGSTAHKMTEDDPNKPIYACDLVLCPGCHAKQDFNLGNSMSGRRTRRVTAV